MGGLRPEWLQSSRERLRFAADLRRPRWPAAECARRPKSSSNLAGEDREKFREDADQASNSVSRHTHTASEGSGEGDLLPQAEPLLFPLQCAVMHLQMWSALNQRLSGLCGEAASVRSCELLCAPKIRTMKEFAAAAKIERETLAGGHVLASSVCWSTL